MTLGVISPNMRMARVITPTATARPLLANILYAISVARAEAPMLTRLFPMRMEVSSALGFLTQMPRGSRFRSRACMIAWNLALDRLTKAVSDPEKNPEKTRHTNMVTHSQVGTGVAGKIF